MKKISLIFVLAIIAIITAACSNSNESMKGHDMSNMDMSGSDKKEEQSQTSDKKDTSNLPITTAIKEITEKSFTITAKEAVNQFDSKHKFAVWTFNGSVPGSQIKLIQGDKVNITLKNELSKPVSIHWHGLPVPNSQDGIPGVTMNAVQPGESFTYKFTATVPGTFWYHSHQDSVNQLDKGLYGSLIVEGKNEQKVDKDYTLVLDEWISSGDTMEDMGGMDMGGMDMGKDHDMSDMDMGSDSNKDSEMGNMEMMGEDMSMYDLYTINGKSGASIEPLKVNEGDKVRIRLINAGYISHQIHIHGHNIKVTATDGNAIKSPTIIKDQAINVAPGERYDVEFIADNPGKWFIEDHSKNDAAKNMVAKLIYEGSNNQTDERNFKTELPVLDITKYGKGNTGQFSLDQKYDVEYKMDLNTEMNNQGMVYTINGKTFPDTDPVNVKEGDLVKVTLTNKSKSEDHPMHLHGHFFQVLSKNGKPLSGSPIVKDTLNLKPGDEYVVAFKADNPGNWMFHCHDLHHASAGMVTQVEYDGFKPTFKVDPTAGNMPE